MTKTISTQNRAVSPRPFFASLDGFRGLLALFVAIHHTHWFSYMNYGTFISEGFVLIDLFFVFSGFLLYRLYGHNLHSGADVADFVKRRFARLYPIHLFMLFGFVLFNLFRLWGYNSGFIYLDPGDKMPFVEGADDSWAAILSHIFLLHSLGIHDSLTFNWPSWTISAEFYVYFIFAAIILFFKPNKAWQMAVLAAFVGVIYYGLSRVANNMNITYDYGFWRCLAGFLTGVIGAWMYMRNEHLRERITPFVWTLLEVFALCLYLSFTLVFLGKSQFFIGPVALLFVFIFAYDGGLISKFMSNKLFSYLAKISYSVYMTHALIAVLFDILAKRFFSAYVKSYTEVGGIGGDVYIVIYLLFVILVSHITWRVVEGYGGRWLSRALKIRRRSKVAAKVAATA